MLLLLLSAGAWLHALLWGAGLARLAMPSRWRGFWPMLALTAGLTLQSVAVWLAALAGLHGTQSYALALEAVPLALLAAAAAGDPGKMAREFRRALPVLAVSLVTLAALVAPYLPAYHGLTTGSMGSCDAADYAAGARCFMEFARGDRTGFMGLVEVTRVASVDHFFDFYLKLMHFSPCAIIALNGSVFGCAPHEIIAALGAVFLAAAVPIVFWISRSLLLLGAAPSLGIALLFGMSPVNWYAVHQAALAQLLAAQGIGLLTWGCWTLWRHPSGKSGGASMFGVLAVAYALILGSYSFIVVVCLVPAVAFAGGIALRTRQYGRFGRWLAWVHLPLAAMALLFATRVWSIAERFIVFKRYDEGWRIPFLWPEGWLGVVRGPFLHPLAEPWHAASIILLAVALVATFMGLGPRGRTLLFRTACLTVPSLIGCVYLDVRGIQWGHGENRSYLAYKLFSVFYPGILPSLCVWMLLAYRRGVARVFFCVVMAAVIAGVARVDMAFFRLMKVPPHVVEKEILDLRSLEGDPAVGSLNLMVADMWSRLWTNSFLLRKAHYFPTHTYEGRLNTPLRGDWDLNGGLVRVTLPAGESRQVNATYSLASTSGPHFVRVELGVGWHEPEHLQRTPIHWIWSRGDATIRISNPHPYPLVADLRFELRSRRLRDVQFWLNGAQVGRGDIGRDLGEFDLLRVTLPPGDNLLDLRSQLPPTGPSDEDGRPLGFALYSLNVGVAGGPVSP